MTNVEWQALQWCRTSHTGRQMQKYIMGKIAETRRVYEERTADEKQRLLLAAYKDLYRILFEADMKELD